MSRRCAIVPGTRSISNLRLRGAHTSHHIDGKVVERAAVEQHVAADEYRR
jgi:hypothetical protein